VNDLSRTSKSAHEKLETIEERSDHLLQESENIRGSLLSVAAQTEHLATASTAVGAQIDQVLDHSRTISEQSKEIAAAQAELRAGQAAMRDAVDAGMARVEESYKTLGDGMDRLRDDAAGVERGIRAVGDAMSSRMDGLQRTADDIGSVAGRSLENQMQLLEGQAKAMRELNELHGFQARALEESRETIQKLAHFGQQQQEELLARQEEIRRAHDHLIQNSHSILGAQVVLFTHLLHRSDGNFFHRCARNRSLMMELWFATAGRVQGEAGQHLRGTGQALRPPQRHPRGVPVHQGLLLLLLHHLPHLHAHQRQADARHQGPALFR
jgi:chromosome segregation ATPase